ncbi:hypothetical protein EI94DRAFT_1704203 [Lactarius quietus]|nr:hypothetical protein EI94DRAFT_1704203 [Lactarius quietus]
MKNESYIMHEDNRQSDSEEEDGDRNGDEDGDGSAMTEHNTVMGQSEMNWQLDSANDKGGGEFVPVDKNKEAEGEAEGQAVDQIREEEVAGNCLSMDAVAGRNKDSPPNVAEPDELLRMMSETPAGTVDNQVPLLGGEGLSSFGQSARPNEPDLESNVVCCKITGCETRWHDQGVDHTFSIIFFTPPGLDLRGNSNPDNPLAKATGI